MLSFNHLVDDALTSYFCTPAIEHKVTKPDEVDETFMGLKVSHDPGSSGVPNRALGHFSKQSISLLSHIF
jgi:hypothetical protein